MTPPDGDICDVVGYDPAGRRTLVYSRALGCHGFVRDADAAVLHLVYVYDDGTRWDMAEMRYAQESEDD